MLTETYPNGMSANYTTNQVGETTSVNYTKTTNCGENCIWYSDSVVPTISGQWRSEQSSLANQNYIYDGAGRLVEVQETPSGQGCSVRLYAYDEETNRTSLTSRTPGTGGSCATEGGTVEAHAYDSANRLADAGVTYNPFGEITKLPAADAGGGELTSNYYADGQLESDSQGGQSISYELDPAGRVRQTVDTGTVNSTYLSHYAGPGQGPSWTVEPVSGHWKRYIRGTDGLNAIETDTEEPVLQLRDLKGDIVARASCSETATKLLGTERSTEYGTPTTSKPPKYSWQGGSLLPTELSSGQVAMGQRSYVPAIGRFLQTDPQPGGSANQYAYTYGDPVTENDPSGEYTAAIDEFDEGHVSENAESAAFTRAVELRAEQEEAEEKAEMFEEGPLGIAEWGQPGGDPIAMAAAPCRREENPSKNHCNNQGLAELIVRFGGHVSTEKQIYARYLRQTAFQRKNFFKLKEVFSEIWKGVKETNVNLEQLVNGARVVVTEIVDFIAISE